MKILMVDDHHLILRAYQNLLKEFFEEKETSADIHTATNCDEAAFKIRSSVQTIPYDVVYLDINLPPSRDKEFLSGEDLGKEIREKSSSTSLIVVTAHGEPMRLLNIIKNLEPQGLLVKSDVDAEEFVRAFQAVCNNELYDSQTVMRLARREMIHNRILDDEDRRILFHLSEGVRTKDLTNHIPLSQTAIEKRKKALKEIFEVENEGEMALIKKAKDLGFI